MTISVNDNAGRLPASQSHLDPADGHYMKWRVISDRLSPTLRLGARESSGEQIQNS
jgi:hypothetical protein